MKTLAVSAVFGVAYLAASACSGRANEALPPMELTEVRVALLQHSYWGGGFDRPLLLALKDGRVLFPSKSERGYPLEYSLVSLEPAQLDSVLVSWGVGPALWALDSVYDFAPNVTDQHSFYLLLTEHGRSKVIQLRSTLVVGDTMRAAAPSAFQLFYRATRAFAPPNVERWSPDSVEVAIWPYEYAPDDPPVAWPSDWPGLDHARWSREPDEVVGELRYLRLPFADAPRLDSIIQGRRERQAIGISGKKWALGYRWLFPAERTWRRVGNRLES
jgi:hypothetical protein